MSEVPKGLSIVEMAKRKAEERIPEVRAEVTELLNQRDKLNLVLNSLYIDRNTGKDPAILNEAKHATWSAEDRVRAAVQAASEDLKIAKIDPNKVTKDALAAAQLDAESFKTSNFAKDEHVKLLHNKVASLRAIESASRDSQPHLDLKLLNDFGIPREDIDSKIAHMRAIDMHPNPDDNFYYPKAVREILEAKRHDLDVQINAATADSPNLKEVVKELIKEREPSPREAEIAQELAQLESESLPLDTEYYALAEAERQLSGEERRMQEADETFQFIEKNYRYLLQAPLDFHSSQDSVQFAISTEIPFKIIKQKEEERRNTVKVLRGKKLELQKKKTGGMFGALRMSEEDKRAGVALIDEQIQALVDPSIQAKEGTLLPTQNDIRINCDEAARRLKTAFNNEDMRELLKANNIPAQGTVGQFMSRVRDAISAHEAERIPQRTTKKAEIAEKEAAISGPRTAIAQRRDRLQQEARALQNHQRETSYQARNY